MVLLPEFKDKTVSCPLYCVIGKIPLSFSVIGKINYIVGDDALIVP